MGKLNQRRDNWRDVAGRLFHVDWGVTTCAGVSVGVGIGQEWPAEAPDSRQSMPTAGKFRINWRWRKRRDGKGVLLNEAAREGFIIH